MSLREMISNLSPKGEDNFIALIYEYQDILQNIERCKFDLIWDNKSVRHITEGELDGLLLSLSFFRGDLLERLKKIYPFASEFTRDEFLEKFENNSYKEIKSK